MPLHFENIWVKVVWSVKVIRAGVLPRMKGNAVSAILLLHDSEEAKRGILRLTPPQCGCPWTFFVKFCKGRLRYKMAKKYCQTH